MGPPPGVSLQRRDGSGLAFRPVTSQAATWVAAASASGVYGLFESTARLAPARVAVQDHSGGSERCRTYAELLARVDRLAAALRARGLGLGDRIGLLSENRSESLEIFLAAAKLGACVACQNWRLKPGELRHCLALVAPRHVFVSERHGKALAAARRAPDDPCSGAEETTLGAGYEQLLRNAPAAEPGAPLDPELALLILYTSGTTGLPKGAVLSHRAEIVRNLVVRAEFGVAERDTFVAWSPLYHMGAAECSLGTLMTGGKVVVLEGFDSTRLADIVQREELGWLLLMPGMVGRFADELQARGIRPRGVKLCGVMADLVPPAEIARITRLLAAPYANTFGATETGCPPCSSNRIPIGVAPTRLSKEKSPFCEIRLVDADDREVPPGSPGELCIRGPTLFSGYYQAESTNAHDFRGGWFHMGDVFVQNADGTLDFVDRVKYLIKSGGENIYPAEIERVLLADERVAEAAVVRRVDARWGEVPVAFVAAKDERQVGEALRAELLARCRAELASYKQPKELSFLAAARFPRSASGKVVRHELEKLRIGPGNQHG